MKRWQRELMDKQARKRAHRNEQKRKRALYESLGIRHSMSVRNRESAELARAIEQRVAGERTVHLGGIPA